MGTKGDYNKVFYIGGLNKMDEDVFFLPDSTFALLNMMTSLELSRSYSLVMF